MRPQPIHLIILVIVIILIFGAPKLPGIARNLGKSMKVFKSEVDDMRSSSKSSEDTDADSIERPSGASEAKAESVREDESRRDQ